MYFRKLEDGTIYDLSGKLIFVPINLEYLKIDQKCESFKQYVLNGMKKLNTIEIMNPNGTCHFLDRSTNNYVKNISFYGDYNYIKCTLPI